MLSSLADPRVFEAALARVADKQRAAHSEEPLLPELPSLTSLGMALPELCKRLARTVASGEYQMSPLTPRRVLIEGKLRVLYHAQPLDKVVMTALSGVLSAQLESTFSPHLHSYRQGHSTLGAALSLASYLRAHRRERPDVRTRGLYVLRRDVKAYGDSIPSGPSSLLWPLLRGLLESHGPRLSEQAWQWIRATVRPDIAATPGFDCDSERGIPTGSPLQPLMGNLYLSPMDAKLGGLEGAFYARFGDDMLFAHPEREVAEHARATMDALLEELGLAWSEDKCETLYVNAAGRATASTSSFHGTSHFTYLGLRLCATGQIGLSTRKSTYLLRDLRARMAHAQQLMAGDTLEERAQTLCSVVNAALDPLHPAACRASPLLRRAVTDHAQLKDLDHRIALALAEQLSGRRGPRAFRTLPMVRLRTQFGLRSLVVARALAERAAPHRAEPFAS